MDTSSTVNQPDTRMVTSSIVNQTDTRMDTSSTVNRSDTRMGTSSELANEELIKFIDCAMDHDLLKRIDKHVACTNNEKARLPEICREKDGKRIYRSKFTNEQLKAFIKWGFENGRINVEDTRKEIETWNEKK